MSDLPVIDYTHRSAPVSLRESSDRVRRKTGKSLAVQAGEIWHLRRAFGQLTPREYYYFGLYDDERFTAEAKERFIGVGIQSQILWRCTDTRWWAVGQDKVAFSAYMSSYGFPVLDVQATLHPYRSLRGAHALRTLDDAGDFLRKRANYPLFSKPFDGMRSVGSARIESYDASLDELVLHGGRTLAVDAYLTGIARYLANGYLFQSVQHPHRRVREICGDRLASVRMVVIVGPNGPEPFRAVWKIPAGPNVADNFWRTGNLLAGIDLETGRLTRVITGVATEQVDIVEHPDSRASLVDFVIPDWAELKKLCVDAAATMPGITLQGWDVSPSERGPVLGEVNIGGDFTLPQLGNAAGMLDQRFREYLDSHHFRSASMPPWGFQALPAVRARIRAALAHARSAH